MRQTISAIGGSRSISYLRALGRCGGSPTTIFRDKNWIKKKKKQRRRSREISQRNRQLRQSRSLRRVRIKPDLHPISRL